jgi:tRNA(Ile)-lysidine synthase
LKKTQIVVALKSVGISGREDSTNAGASFFRNRVRRRVIPAWIKAAERDALAGAALSRELLDEDDAALESWVERCGASARRGELALARLAGLPRAVVRRAVRRWLAAERRAGELSRQAFDALLAAVERGAPTRQSLGTRGFAVIRGGVLRFEANRMRPARFQRRPN